MIEFDISCLVVGNLSKEFLCAVNLSPPTSNITHLKIIEIIIRMIISDAQYQTSNHDQDEQYHTFLAPSLALVWPSCSSFQRRTFQELQKL